MNVALGLKARTGRAILVSIGASQQMQVVQRTELKLLPEGDFATYHAAEGLPSAAAQECVARGIASAHRLAEVGIRDAVEALASTGYQICGCGVLIGTGMPPWSTGEILAVHVRMHQAEGELFREVLISGARACGLIPTTLREKGALEEATSRLGLSRTNLETRLVALGKTIGAPWGKDQKEAAAAALVALSANTHRPFDDA